MFGKKQKRIEAQKWEDFLTALETESPCGLMETIFLQKDPLALEMSKKFMQKYFTPSETDRYHRILEKTEEIDVFCKMLEAWSGREMFKDFLWFVTVQYLYTDPTPWCNGFALPFEVRQKVLLYVLSKIEQKYLDMIYDNMLYSDYQTTLCNGDYDMCILFIEKTTRPILLIAVAEDKDLRENKRNIVRETLKMMALA